MNTNNPSLLQKYLQKYLITAPESIKQFILKECEIIFDDSTTKLFLNGVHGWHAGIVNGKHLIKFENAHPKKMTFFHEIAHAYLNHIVTSNEEIYRKQEEEANHLARKWIN